MKFGDIFKGFHRSKCSLRIFLQLLIITAASIHLPIPLKLAIAHIQLIEIEKKRPNEFAVDEIFESFGAAVMQKFGQIFDLVGLCLISECCTFSKILASVYSLIIFNFVSNHN